MIYKMYLFILNQNRHPNLCRVLCIVHSSTTKTVYSYDKSLSIVKDGLQSYFDKTYSRSSIKYSKELLDHFYSRSFSKMSSTETFDFCTLYATIPREN